MLHIHDSVVLRAIKCEMHCWTSESPHKSAIFFFFFFTKEIMYQFQKVWCNLQLGVSLCIAGGDKRIPLRVFEVQDFWDAEWEPDAVLKQTHDSWWVIDRFGPDTSADRSRCMKSFSLLLFLRFVVLLLSVNHFRSTTVHWLLPFQDFWRRDNQLCENTSCCWSMWMNNVNVIFCLEF